MIKVQDYNRKARAKSLHPAPKSGDIVKIHRKIKEGNKERVQVFEGIVIAMKGGQSSSPMMTVRRVTHGTGVEITFPLISPAIQKIEIIKKVKTRRAKLYYLRRKDFKLSGLKTKELGQFVADEEKIEPIAENSVSTEDTPEENKANPGEKKS